MFPFSPDRSPCPAWLPAPGNRRPGRKRGLSFPGLGLGLGLGRRVRLRLLLLAAGSLTAGGMASGGTSDPEPSAGPPLPPRPAAALSGSAVAAKVTGLSLEDREEVFAQEILSGNVPDFWRKFVKLRVSADEGQQAKAEGEGKNGTPGGDSVVFWVAPDYLAVGSDADYFRIPLTPGTAQSLADRLDCLLPTRRMVDKIHAAAALKLQPLPRTPGPAMTSVEFFRDYQILTAAQRSESLTDFPLGALTAGHQKDVVISALTATQPGKVSIYGWHRPDGSVIQPLYAGHTAAWVDYSHGIRLVRRAVLLNGQPSTLEAVLADPAKAALLSDEGAVKEPRYPASDDARFSERMTERRFDPGIRALINRPAHPDPAKPLRLVIFATPNGNSIEETLGRHVPAGADWHFEIQHAAAQMRWVRRQRPEETWVLACLECPGKAWPAWRRQQADAPALVSGIVDALRKECGGGSPGFQIILTGHSGGGAFTFAFLDSAETLPADLGQIAFLDSNYGYDATKGHGSKLSAWLKADPGHQLTVIAYHDSNALLNGKSFVSEQGGTWGRSQAMLADFAPEFPFTETTSGPLRRASALDGRLRFLLMENPDHAILHTRLVEKNGLIHALLAGTPQAEKDYLFFGDPVYRDFIGGLPGEVP